VACLFLVLAEMWHEVKGDSEALLQAVRPADKPHIQQVKSEKRYFNLSGLKEEGSENRTTSRR
jgi:hypothetical protein